MPDSATTITYFAMRPRTGGVWHLGSDSRDLRTYCGIMLQPTRARSDVELVSCPACRHRAAWRYAQDQEAR